MKPFIAHTDYLSPILNQHSQYHAAKLRQAVTQHGMMIPN